MFSVLALLGMTACGGGEETSLRDSLEQLPRDPAEARIPDTEPAPVPVDTAPTAALTPDSSPAPDTVAPEALPLEPPPPNDLRPWVPDHPGLALTGEWTAGVVARPRPETEPATLVEVRSARNEGYDRVVFEFAGDSVPGYHVEYVDTPVRQCGSGNPVEVAGEGWLRVRFSPAAAHDDQGQATVEDRERMVELPVIQELQLICDFEGQVEWVLGTTSPNRYRVLDLRDPARLVVDIQH